VHWVHIEDRPSTGGVIRFDPKSLKIQRRSEGYFPANFSGNENWENKLLWWDHEIAHEQLEKSRPNRDEIHRIKTLTELQLFVEEFLEDVERLLVFRANPEYNKDVDFSSGMVVGKMLRTVELF